MVHGSGAADFEWAAAWRAEHELQGPHVFASGPVEQANLGVVGMRVHDWKTYDKPRNGHTCPKKETGVFQ